MRDSERERGNMRRYYEGDKGGGEEFGRRDKDEGIEVDKCAAGEEEWRRGEELVELSPL